MKKAAPLEHLIQTGVREEEVRKVEFEQRQQALEEEIEACVQSKDFLKAIVLKEQLESLREAGPKGVSSHQEGREDRGVEDRARAERSALEEKIAACVNKCDWQQALEEEIEACVQSKDFLKAITLNEELVSPARGSR